MHQLYNAEGGGGARQGLLAQNLVRLQLQYLTWIVTVYLWTHYNQSTRISITLLVINRQLTHRTMISVDNVGEGGGGQRAANNEI